MEPIVIVLAGEPRGSGRPRFSRKTGFAYTPPETRNYHAALRMAAQQAMASTPPLAGPLKVTVEAVFTVPASWSKRKRAAALAGVIRPTGKPDCDNILKAIDGCNTVAWGDDAQIVDGRIVKLYGEAPYLRIEVSPLTVATPLSPAPAAPSEDLFAGAGA